LCKVNGGVADEESLFTERWEKDNEWHFYKVISNMLVEFASKQDVSCLPSSRQTTGCLEDGKAFYNLRIR
jgi:hypothetical protein